MDMEIVTPEGIINVSECVSCKTRYPQWSILSTLRCASCQVAEKTRSLDSIHRVAREALKGVEQGDEGVEISDATPEGAVKSVIAVRDAQIKRIEPQIGTLKKILERVEWAKVNIADMPSCPLCGGIRHRAGHDESCDLGRALHGAPPSGAEKQADEKCRHVLRFDGGPIYCFKTNCSEHPTTEVLGCDCGKRTFIKALHAPECKIRKES